MFVNRFQSILQQKGKGYVHMCVFMAMTFNTNIKVKCVSIWYDIF